MLGLDLLYFDSATGTQFLYDCINSTKATALINFATTTLGVPIPAATVSSFMKLLSVGHFDVTFIASNLTSVAPALQAQITAQVNKTLPKWQWSSMTNLNPKEC